MTDPNRPRTATDRHPQPRDHVLDVLADLVVKLASGETILIACVDTTPAPGLATLLDQQRRRIPMPSGSATWRPQWHDQRLTALKLCARVDTAPPLELTLRFALPARAKTLARRPTQIAVTDPPGFAQLERTHRLPWALLLPAISTSLLDELLELDQPV